jgi:hypothetical protein
MPLDLPTLDEPAPACALCSRPVRTDLPPHEGGWMHLSTPPPPTRNRLVS